jgi:hypothetical protein
MLRNLTALIGLVVLGLAPCAAAGNPIVGKWELTSVDGSGRPQRWTMVVAETGGKLSGSVNGSGENPAEMPMIEPKLEGKTFTFKVDVNPNCMVKASLTEEGKTFEGRFECAQASGTLKGAKKP